MGEMPIATRLNIVLPTGDGRTRSVPCRDTVGGSDVKP